MSYFSDTRSILAIVTIVSAIAIFCVGGDPSRFLRRNNWHRSQEYKELKEKSNREYERYLRNRQ
ncbi:MAG: hypothetical protein AAF483_08815 [Planctomycetota bacterium]